MNIAIIGYGKMGKEIEKIALDRGHKITLKVTSANANYSADDLKDSDVAIEFSTPEAALSNIGKCFDANVPVVVGTTAWYESFEQVAKRVNEEEKGLFYATNFSLGVNIFFHINETLARVMNNYPEYDVEIEEIHHTQKLDAPSGTAITTAEGVLDNISRKKKWELDSSSGSEALNVTAKRLPDVPGTHIVTYESEIDKIELSHEAKNRKGFALGSVLAAEFIKDKQGLFTMKDLLKFN